MSVLEQHLARLRMRFLERCEADRASLLGPLDDNRLIEIAHRISGSAGMFGFTSLGATAQLFEESLRTGDGHAAALKNRLLAEIKALQAR